MKDYFILLNKVVIFMFIQVKKNRNHLLYIFSSIERTEIYFLKAE